MKKFILTSDKFEGHVAFVYDQNGRLISYDNQAQMTEVQMEFLLRHLPVYLEYEFSQCSLKAFAAMSDSMKVVEATDKIAFEEFWKAFNYTHGSKVKAEAAWNKLALAEQIAAMRYLPKYRHYVATTQTGHALATTYINGKYWVK